MGNVAVAASWEIYLQPLLLILSSPNPGSIPETEVIYIYGIVSYCQLSLTLVRSAEWVKKAR